MQFRTIPLSVALMLSTSIGSIQSMEDDVTKIKQEGGYPYLRSAYNGELISVMDMKYIKEHLPEINFENGVQIGAENCLPCVISGYNWLNDQTISPQKVGDIKLTTNNMEIFSNPGFAVLTDAVAASLLPQKPGAFMIDDHTVSSINTSKPHFMVKEQRQLGSYLESIRLKSYGNS